MLIERNPELPVPTRGRTWLQAGHNHNRARDKLMGSNMKAELLDWAAWCLVSKTTCKNSSSQYENAW